MLTSERLHDIALELSTRPSHEKVRALVYELLVNGLEAKSTEIDFEHSIPEVHGRIDALLGRTIFEFKSDLRRERQDAEGKLPDYVSQRENETGTHFIAVVTDGASFTTYELRSGSLQQLDTFSTVADKPHELLGWLSSVVGVNEDLEPTAEVVRRELGRSSLAWLIAKKELAAVWEVAGNQQDVRLKRDLWAQLLRYVYGSAFNEDILFLQHTYLTIIAKTMAAKVLGVPLSQPQDLLSGRSFHEAGIGGVVESDFFDWPLVSLAGTNLINRISQQASRFKLEDVHTDVLKGLYESLIDPDQRHFLGEYYTPDWLAEKICTEAVTNPLEQRVLDPACGSGTFLFHAVRLLLKAAEKANLPVSEAISLACNQIFGVDVHPVSAQIARVTFLLAIGQKRLKYRPASFNIPIYIGDALQWNTRGFLADRDVLIEVPDGPETLEFPVMVARDPALFDTVINGMLERSHQKIASADGLKAWLERDYKLDGTTLYILGQTYGILHSLQESGRDHIWGFVARNLIRPVWLAQESQKVDVLVGNPPWLSYRFMDNAMQQRFRKESQEHGLWAGGKVATHQDLSGYFFARCVELYLKPKGIIAFVMPYATMTRRQFDGFRTGTFGNKNGAEFSLVYANVKFTSAWVLSDKVQPLFPVPSCVLFATSGKGKGKALPKSVLSVSGVLPKRDAVLLEAAKALVWKEIPWPKIANDKESSSYRERFKNGAIIVPRVLSVVELVPSGTLGSNPTAPLVQSRRTSQEKKPWKDLPPLRGNIEGEFLCPLLLGESIAPFRMLKPVLSIIPWDKKITKLLNSDSAQKSGYIYLAKWLQNAELLWAEYGQPKLTFIQQLDYYGKLSSQFPISPIRVTFSASGTLPAACLVCDMAQIVEHALYWIPVITKIEGQYLLSILNSETARKKIEGQQATGQWGARHFDKVMLSLPIPQFNPTKALHMQLVKAAAHAEEVAATVPLKEGTHFIRARQDIRATLLKDGISKKIDKLVAQLLCA